MEVAGLTASIITLIGAATLAGSTVSRIWGLRDALPLYVLTALNEINDFKATLKLVQYALESLPETPPDFIDQEITRFLGRAETSLAAFNSYLQDKVLCEGTDGSDSIKLRRRAKLKEILGEAQSEMSVLQQELASIKLSLNTALTAMHIRNSGRLAMSIQQVHVIRSGQTTTLSAGDSVSTATFMEEVITSGTIGATRDLPSAAEKDGIVLIHAQSTHRRCQRECPCQCHMVSEGSSPRWLQGLIGAAFYNFTGVPCLNRRTCNFKFCANGTAKHGKIHIQYMFPVWVLPVAIEMTASWRCLRGIVGTWTLRIPRMLKFDQRRLDYLFEHGTVSDLEMAMHEYQIRACDMLSMGYGGKTLFELAIIFDRVDFGSMLLSKGLDLEHQDCDGLTLAQIFWVQAFCRKEWQDLARTPQLIESRDNISLVPGHDLVLNKLSNDLASHIERNPSCVLAQDSFGFTLLHWAVQCSDQMTVDILLKAGADVNAVSRTGASALMYAVQSWNSFICCQALIEYGADFNIVDKSGLTVLDYALRSQPTCDRTIELLLRAGSDILMKLHEDEFFLFSAVVHGASASACSLLLDFGAELDRLTTNGNSLAKFAVSLNKHDLLELFIRRGAVLTSLNEGGYSKIISSAAFLGDVRTMQILTEARIDGLPMTFKHRQEYWVDFEYRDKFFVGLRQSPEVERAAFQALLDSIIPMDPNDVLNKFPPLSPKKPAIPGSFPLDGNEEDAEDSEVSTDDQPAFSDDEDDPSSCRDQDLHAPNNTCNSSGHEDVASIITDDDEADVPEEEMSTCFDTSHDQDSLDRSAVL